MGCDTLPGTNGCVDCRLAGRIYCYVIAFSVATVFGPFVEQSQGYPFCNDIYSIFYNIKFLKEFPKPKKITVFLTALGIAMAISIRIGGLLLIAYIAMFSGLYFLFSSNLKALFAQDNLLRLRRLATYLLIIFILGYVMGILLWPYGISDPVKNPLYALKSMTNFGINLRQLFEGELIWSNEVPWYYSLKYILISTPFVIVAGFVLSIFLTIQLRKHYNLLFVFYLFFAFLFPIIYIIYQDSNVYGGWRHVLFAYPTFVGLAAIGYETLARTINKRVFANYIFIPLVLIMAIHPIKHIIKNHPYQYVYYNELFGGVDEAFAEYELDYYYHSLKEGSEWFKKNVLDKTTIEKGKKIILAVNHHPSDVNYYLRKDTGKVQVIYTKYYSRCRRDWDYGVFANCYINPGQLKRKLWPPKNTIHEIRVGKSPVCAVVKRDVKKFDYHGLKVLDPNNEGYNPDTALLLLEKAYIREPYNDCVLQFLTNLCFDLRKPKKALVYARCYMKANPRSSDGHLLLGKAYLINNQLDNAIISFRNATKIEYKENEAYYWAGICYLQTRPPSLTTAIEQLQKALEYGFRPQNNAYAALRQAYLMSAEQASQNGNEMKAAQDKQIASQIEEILKKGQ
jgi:hypothetical protein